MRQAESERRPCSVLELLIPGSDLMPHTSRTELGDRLVRDIQSVCLLQHVRMNRRQIRHIAHRNKLSVEFTVFGAIADDVWWAVYRLASDLVDKKSGLHSDPRTRWLLKGAVLHVHYCPRRGTVEDILNGGPDSAKSPTIGAPLVGPLSSSAPNHILDVRIPQPVYEFHTEGSDVYTKTAVLLNALRPSDALRPSRSHRFVIQDILLIVGRPPLRRDTANASSLADVMSPTNTVQHTPYRRDLLSPNAPEERLETAASRRASRNSRTTATVTPLSPKAESSDSPSDTDDAQTTHAIPRLSLPVPRASLVARPIAADSQSRSSSGSSGESGSSQRRTTKGETLRKEIRQLRNATSTIPSKHGQVLKRNSTQSAKPRGLMSILFGGTDSDSDGG